MGLCSAVSTSLNAILFTSSLSSSAVLFEDSDTFRKSATDLPSQQQSSQQNPTDFLASFLRSSVNEL